MPAIYERPFRVRHMECDAYGHVNHAHYLRYMQEAALDASAAVGYDIARYEALGTLWLLRQTAIRYERPLRYGDTVIVKTWVADFRRATSRRRYELRLAGSDQIVAQAYSDWVYLDSESLRPRRVPPEMASAFAPDGKLEPVERQPFPAFPDPPPGVFTLRRRARWSEIDPAGHVNNAAYLTLLEDAAMELMATRAWTAGRLQQAGLGIVAREYRLEYLEPAVLDDDLEVATWVSAVKRATATRHYTIHRHADGALLLRAQALWVWVDLASGRPRRIPEDFLATFADNVSG
ncbi:MAG: acyl-[acyl-carrier-protein] thioesterase [Candidatus Promineifilaceae bacterium]